MPQLIVTKQWQTSATEPLTEANLDAMKSSIETFFNTTGLDSDNFQDGGISTANLANLSVTTAKLADQAVGTTALAATSVTQAKRVATDLTQVLYTSTLTMTSTGRPMFLGFNDYYQGSTNGIVLDPIFISPTATLTATITLSRTQNSTTSVIAIDSIKRTRGGGSTGTSWGLTAPLGWYFIDTGVTSGSVSYTLTIDTNGDGGMVGSTRLLGYEL